MNDLRKWKRADWKEALARLRMTRIGFAAAIPLSPSALDKVFRNDPNRPPHAHTWERVEKTFYRLEQESKAAG